MQERIAQIKQYIQEKGEVKLTELEALLPGVSSMTLRRDLQKLEEMGVAVRTKGGAKSISHLSRIKEELYATRTLENMAEKTAIAKKALGCIEEDRSIFLDSGTTVMCLAQFLDSQKLFITTSSPNIALECIKNPNATVNAIGGSLSRENLSFSGITALNFLDNINIDIAFMAASGFSMKNGFTGGDFNECEIKKRVIEKASKVIVLMDSSKLGKNLPFTFAKPGDIDTLISDDRFPKDIIRQLGRGGKRTVL